MWTVSRQSLSHYAARFLVRNNCRRFLVRNILIVSNMLNLGCVLRCTLKCLTCYALGSYAPAFAGQGLNFLIISKKKSRYIHGNN